MKPCSQSSKLFRIQLFLCTSNIYIYIYIYYLKHCRECVATEREIVVRSGSQVLSGPPTGGQLGNFALGPTMLEAPRARQGVFRDFAIY